MKWYQHLTWGLVFALSGLANPARAAFMETQSSTSICPAQLDAQMSAIRAKYSNAGRERWGILVESLTGDDAEGNILYRHNDRQYFIPASNAKLLTTAAALNRFDPQFRIRTPVYSTPAGLRVAGRGDPSIGNEQLDLLARQVAAAGVQRVEELIFEDGYLQGAPYNPHWQWEDVQAGYGAPSNSLIFDRNAVPFTLFPAALGQPLRVEWDDADEGKRWRVENQTITVAEGEPEFIEVGRSLTEPILYVSGQLIAGSPSEPASVAVVNPGERFAEKFTQALERAGVTVGRTRVMTEATTAAGEEIAAIESPSISELVTEVNQFSDNLYAQTLLRLMGAMQDRTNASSQAAGIAVVQKTLSELGVEPDSYILSDGSGLSRLNSISPQALVQTLRAMAISPFADIYLNSLPLAGESGTLSSRFGDLTSGEVRAKTGTVSGVSSLSGYIGHSDYDRLIFSIIVNHSDRSVATQRQAIDEMVTLLTRLQPCSDG